MSGERQVRVVKSGALGRKIADGPNPNGVAPLAPQDDEQRPTRPRRGTITQGSRVQQPWAERFNPFGVGLSRLKLALRRRDL
jgi:hypothetical protein